MDEITLSVLGLKKENSWDVVALEMDLVTSGKTFEKALNNLKNLIEDQLSFASYKNQPELAFKSAPLEYFSLFAQVKHDLMRHTVNNTVDETSDYLISGIPMPSAHVIAEMTNNFSPVNA